MAGPAVNERPYHRLMEKDGTFNVARRGKRRFAINDLYHTLLSAPWPAFMVFVFGSYLVINLFFATGYFLCGPHGLEGTVGQAAHDRFVQDFFFSVQTFATIGYGKLSPVGIGANVLVTLEALVGLMGFAMATGMLFARFSRPTARVMFSRRATLTVHDGVPSLVFRIANERKNQIVEAQVNVTLSILERTSEGETYRTFTELPLERGHSPIFALSWTIVHPIDEKSPLFRKGAVLTREELEAQESEFLVSLAGIDNTFSQMIHARTSYLPSEIVWGGRFVDIMKREGPVMTVDLDQLHEVVPG